MISALVPFVGTPGKPLSESVVTEKTTRSAASVLPRTLLIQFACAATGAPGKTNGVTARRFFEATKFASRDSRCSTSPGIESSQRSYTHRYELPMNAMRNVLAAWEGVGKAPAEV